MTEMPEIQLIKEAYGLGIFDVYGNDPYTIELILLNQAWMKATSADVKENTHLWGFVKKLKPAIPIPPDVTYRDRMKRLWKRDVVEPVKIGRGQRPKFDYKLTEYGEAVCKEHINSLSKQIRLEKWRKRARRST
jgi:hypothetical protein